MEPKAISTVEELRTRIVKGIDGALSFPLFSRFLKADDLRMIQAERAFWMDDDGSQLARLLALYRKEPE